MDRPGITPATLRFGLFELDPVERWIKRKGAPVRLQDQPFLVLTLLLENPGEIVTREELRHRLWPDGTYVDFEGSLNAVLKRLRAALNDDPDQPRFIETVPKRGYRFIAPVTRVPKAGLSPSQADPPQPNADLRAGSSGAPDGARAAPSAVAPLVSGPAGDIAAAGGALPIPARQPRRRAGVLFGA